MGSADSVRISPRTIESGLDKTVSSSSRSASKQRKAARRSARCQTAPGLSPEIIAKISELERPHPFPEFSSQELKESSKFISGHERRLNIEAEQMEAKEKDKACHPPATAHEPVLLTKEEGKEEAEQAVRASSGASRASSSTEEVNLPAV